MLDLMMEALLEQPKGGRRNLGTSGGCHACADTGIISVRKELDGGSTEKPKGGRRNEPELLCG